MHGVRILPGVGLGFLCHYLWLHLVIQYRDYKNDGFFCYILHFSVIELPRTAFYHVSQIGWFKFADLQIYGKITNAYIPHMLIDRNMIWRFHLFATVQIRWQFHYAVWQSLVIMPQQFLDIRWQDSCHTLCKNGSDYFVSISLRLEVNFNRIWIGRKLSSVKVLSVKLYMCTKLK